MTAATTSLKTILFDLDGTLADTAPDLALSLNLLLKEQGRETLPFTTIRPHVSHGATAMVRLGFGLGPDDADFAPLRLRFLEIYQNNLSRHTALFDGMGTLLTDIEQRGMRWGVVTNKPARLTEPLMADLGLAQRAACIVSGDTTARNKPHPEPILYACRLTNSDIAECLYVGDAERDIEAGNKAGMPTLVALFGYIGESEQPLTWGASGAVRTPAEILTWIDQFNRTANP
jgi:phosphoglycolate phosphatase